MSKKSSTTLAAPGSQQTSEQRGQALEVVAPGTLSPSTLATLDAASRADADTYLGQQLTAQYHRATGGMTEVLRFGGMMMQLQETLFTREQGLL